MLESHSRTGGAVNLVESRPFDRLRTGYWSDGRWTAFWIATSAIPAEHNYLLNPLHPSFSKIKIGKPQDFITDLRLLNR